MRELFENEWFPKAYAMGVSWNEFWSMNPHIIALLKKGHNEKIKEKDYLSWLSGKYTLSAVWVAVEHNLFGEKAKSEYIKEALLYSALDEKEKNSNKESKEEVAVFEMKQRIKTLRMQGLPESPA